MSTRCMHYSLKAKEEYRRVMSGDPDRRSYIKTVRVKVWSASDESTISLQFGRIVPIVTCTIASISNIYCMVTVLSRVEASEVDCAVVQVKEKFRDASEVDWTGDKR